MEDITKSAKETRKLGEKVANSLKIKGKGLPTGKAESKVKGAKVIALTGKLGSGKTTFVQGLAAGLGIKQRVISPTFIIMRKYQLRLTNYDLLYTNFYHVDLYRLEKNIHMEVRNLGVEEIWNDPINIVVIEWAEKIKDVIPKNATWIKLENVGENRRKIVIND